MSCKAHFYSGSENSTSFTVFFREVEEKRATDTDLSLVVEYATTDSKEKYEGLSR